MNKYAIIVAGGSGTRFGSEIPKQFLPLKGIPVLMHTIAAFSKAISDIKIFVVLPDSQIGYWSDLCKKHQFAIPHTIVAGGSSRFHSVKNAIDSIHQQHGLVAVHDGVRPIISQEMICESFSTAEKHNTAIPAIEVTDSIRMLDTTEGSHALNRSLLRAVQTPQTFSLKLLKDAYGKGETIIAQNDGTVPFTDDASVVEATHNLPITLYRGDVKNIKITHPDDLFIAQYLMDKE